MQRFNYVAKDAAGNEQRGVVEAQNMAEAQLVLRQNNLTAKSLVPEGGAKKKKGALNIQLKMPKFLQSKRVKPKDLTVLTRQLATLVSRAFRSCAACASSPSRASSRASGACCRA